MKSNFTGRQMRLGVAMETKPGSLRGAERCEVKCESQSPLLRCRKYQRIWRGWQETCPCDGLFCVAGYQRLSAEVSSQLSCHPAGTHKIGGGMQTPQLPSAPSLLRQHIRIAAFPSLPVGKVNNKRVTRLNHKALADNSPFRQLH